MSYLIIPSESSDLYLDPEKMSEQLRKKWPMVEFRHETFSENILLEWEIRAEDVNHVGMIHNDNRTLTIDDDPAGVAQFTIWYRQIIPEKHDIFIYHDSDAEMEVRITIESLATEVEEHLKGNT